MKILFITNVSSPYRVIFFNMLGQQHQVTVFYEYKKEPTEKRNISWQEDHPTYYRAQYRFRLVNAKQYDKVIICGISTPKEIKALLYLKLHHIPYILEIDGGLPKQDKMIKKAIKTFLISGAQKYFSTGEMADNYLTTYGAKRERIVRYPFTSVCDKDIVSVPPTREKKERLRKQLGLKEKRILISVGRFSYQNGYGKGFDTLLHIAEALPEDIGVYIIGDQPTEEFVRWKEEKNLSHVHYLSFMNKQKLFTYYQAADLSLFLTRGDVWGLVVNESMANALPVISTNACVAGLELVKDGQNGFIVPVNSVSLTREKILSYLDDEECQERFSQNCLDAIQGYTMEKMVEVHEDELKKK